MENNWLGSTAILSSEGIFQQCKTSGNLEVHSGNSGRRYSRYKTGNAVIQVSNVNFNVAVVHLLEQLQSNSGSSKYWNKST